MKRILILFSAAAVLFSCTKVTPDVISEEINFTPVAGKVATKDPISNTTYPTNIDFGAFAYKGNSLYIPKSQIKYNTGSPATWKATTPYYWPADGALLAFFAYSPFSISGANTTIECSPTNGIIINNYSTNDNPTADLMVADTVHRRQNESHASYNGVKTVFKHTLAYIAEIKVKTNENYRVLGGTGGTVPQAGDKVFTIKEVKVINAFTNGNFTQLPLPSTPLHTGTWSDQSTTNTYTLFSGTKDVPHSTADALTIDVDDSGRGYLFVIPQALTNVKISVKYQVKTHNGDDYVVENDVTKTFSLYDSEVHEQWQINKKYTYTITLGLNEIYWAPSVTDWDASDASFSYEI